MLTDTIDHAVTQCSANAGPDPAPAPAGMQKSPGTRDPNARGEAAPRAAMPGAGLGSCLGSILELLYN